MDINSEEHDSPIEEMVGSNLSEGKLLNNRRINYTKLAILISLSELIFIGAVGVKIWDKKSEAEENQIVELLQSSQSITKAPTAKILPTITSTPTIEPPVLDNILIQQLSDGWMSFTHRPFVTSEDRLYSWVGFVMEYPSGWNLEVRERNETSANLFVHVEKADGSYFDLLQGFSEGGRCLLPDDPEYETYEGVGEKFTKYREFEDKAGISLRLAEYDKPTALWTHKLCEYRNGEFNTENSINIFKIKLTTQESVNEFVEMIERLEILR